MAFDISTAKPVSSSGFDMATAQPEQPAQEFDLESFNPGGEIGGPTGPAPIPPTTSDQLVAIGETLLTLGTGATTGTVGHIGGVLEQLSKEIISGEFGSSESADRVQANAAKRSSQLTNLPETELGKERVGQVGAALAPLAALTPLGAELSAVARSATSVPLRLTPQGQAISQVVEGVKGFQRKPSRELASEIQAGTRSRDVAKVELRPQRTFEGEPTGIEKFFDTRGPKIQKDSLASKAVTQGFDEGVIQPLKNSSKNDKAFMKKMVGIADKIRKDKLFGLENRPGDVAGDVLMGKVKAIRDANKRAGVAINKAALGLKGKPIDVTQAGDKFRRSLEDIGIKVSDDLKLDFRGSDIEFQGGPKSTIRNVFSRMIGAKPDALAVHKLKRLIDSEVTYGKSLKGLAGNAERTLKELRANLDNLLDSNFPAYDKANIAYRETISALDSLQSVAGKKMNLTGPNADKATGTLMRRLMSNAQSRVNLLDSLTEIEAVVKKHGGSDLLRIGQKGAVPDNLKMLVLFADELDSVFGPAARTSLQGQFDQAISRGARATTKSGALDVAADLAIKGVEKARGINESNAIKSIRDLLNKE